MQSACLASASSAAAVRFDRKQTHQVLLLLLRQQRPANKS
jgi:hypothetical protein